MKFFTIEIPVYVKEGVRRGPYTVSVEMTMSDDATARDAAERFERLLQEKLETVDIGDCE